MRRQSREIALQVLFQVEYAPQISFNDLINLFEQNRDQSLVKYADIIVRGVGQYREKIDHKIQEASRHWKIERMGGVDRNILRMAVYEMFYADELIEPKIAINEAIEIAKIFGTQESASFVNGLLDQVVRNERK
ncbi:transcription antitermination factor NusB [Pseudobdellovibrio exovorus]|uniref:Transcription antitermination protein NusB n=1 Tax=Pseudobdellovibrio exovorus JSS TaxID=1184267 RepID=M4V6S5_9BACT|nr:transcription antitermination factor NusB [Pseudobdellovibrio exovorus]AGH95067.1 transcription termination factor nusB [Pseudobdellovibrio exovorus JSS]